MEVPSVFEHLQRIVEDVLDTSADVIFRTRDHRWQLLSPSWTVLSGYDVDESIGALAIDLIHPDDRAEFDGDVAAMYRGELVTRTQVRLVTKQGDVRWVVFQGALLRDAAGRVNGVAGVIKDRTNEHLQTTLHEVARTLDSYVLRGEAEAQLLHRVCEALASSMPYPLVWVGLGTTCVDARTGGVLALEEADREALASIAAPAAASAILSPGALADSTLAAKLAHAGVAEIAVISVPSPHGEHLLGIGARSHLGADHIAALESFASRLGLVLRLAAHQALLAIQSAAMTSSLGAMLILDAKGRVEWVNDAFERMSGLTSAEVIGRPALELRPERDRTPEALRSITSALTAGSVWTGELIRKRKNGEEYIVLERVTPLMDELGRAHHFVVAQEDVTGRRRAEALVEHMAHNDRLTNLANRAFFEEHLELGLTGSGAGTKSTAVLFVDLDRFKLINDSLGHTVGDEVLIQAAARIRACIREGDLVARFGGDEFTIVLPSCDENGATRAAAEILARLMQPMRLAHHEVTVTASIGIALGAPGVTDAETLVKQADAAMYQAKALGRNAYAFFTSDLAATSSRALAIKEGLRRALGRGDELMLHYQPQFSSGSGEMIAVEALLRWTSGVLGTISPGEFIPIAEQSGLIADIDRWVMMQACSQAKAWQDAGLNGLRVSVNVSGVSFRKGHVVANIERALATTNLPPELLEIELTEGIMLHDAARVIATLDAVRALGVRVALDDFGTGYSSLGYLKRFKLDVLKIDRSFVTGLPHDPDSAAIARLIVAMATTLRMETIAEGVETPEQAAFLESIGCRTFQGFLFSRALPPEELLALARQKSPARLEVGSRAPRAA